MRLKRTQVFTLVCIWVGWILFTSILPLLRLTFGYSGPADQAPPAFVVAWLVGIGVALYLIIGTVQLHRVQVLGALAVLIVMTVSGVTLLVAAAADDVPSSPGLIPAGITLVLNVATISYLVRPGFWTFRAAFRKEKDAEELRRYAEKTMRKGA